MKASELCKFADEQVKNGSIYVWGGQGQTGSEITEAWIKKRESYNPVNYLRSIALWKRRIKEGYVFLRAYDCSGLIVYFLLENKLLTSDRTANGLYYTESQPVTKAALIPGDLVFKKYALTSKMYHVGIYMGNGSVIHAKGRDDGVVQEGIEKAGWNRYARLNCFAVPESISRLLRKGSKGDDVAIVQNRLIVLGYNLGRWGADGDFGTYTDRAVRAVQKANGLTVDGIVGKATAPALGLIFKA